MREQIISFETAKLAKEKGFNLYQKHSYWKNNLTEITPGYALEDGSTSEENYWKFERYYVPTQSLLQKWLREVHGIYAEVYHDLSLDHKSVQYYANWGYINNPESDKFKYGGQRIGGGYDENADWLTYEEALENALKEGLKLI